MTAMRVATDDRHLTYTQDTPVVSQVIVHNMGKFPAVQVSVPGVGLVECDVQHLDANSVRVSFESESPFTAYLN